MKSLKIFLVIALVVAQIVAIFVLSFARERERDNAKTFYLRCETYDPRDLLRGHYFPVNFEIDREKFSLSKIDESIIDPDDLKSAKESFVLWQNEDKPFSWKTFNLEQTRLKMVLMLDEKTRIAYIAGIYKNAPVYDERSEAIVLDVKAECIRWEADYKASAKSATKKPKFNDGEIYLKPVNHERRFYVSETRAKALDKQLEEARKNPDVPAEILAEVFLRSDGSLGIKNLIVNGVPVK